MASVNPSEIFDYLTQDKGLSDAHALGMLSNIKHESGYDPTVVNSIGATGLFQHYKGRRNKMVDHVGGDLSDWRGQIDFALSENEGQRYASIEFDSAGDAARWFTEKFERPENTRQNADKRARYAESGAYKDLSSMGAGGSPAAEKRTIYDLDDSFETLAPSLDDKRNLISDLDDSFKVVSTGNYEVVKEKPIQESGANAADAALGLGQGVLMGGKMVTDAFGTDNAVSQGLQGGIDWLDQFYSEGKREQDAIDAQERLSLGDDASLFDRTALAFKQTLRNPAMMAQQLGMVAPMVLGGYVAGGAKAVTTLAAMQGAGAVKSGIYENVQNASEEVLMADPNYVKMRQQGLTEQQAKEAYGVTMQSYGENALPILASSVLAAGLSRVGAERLLGQMGGQSGIEALEHAAKQFSVKGVAKTTATEVGTEMVQEPLEQIASNVGAAGGGADFGTYDNVPEAIGAAAAGSLLPSAGMSTLSAASANRQLAATRKDKQLAADRALNEISAAQNVDDVIAAATQATDTPLEAVDAADLGMTTPSEAIDLSGVIDDGVEVEQVEHHDPALDYAPPLSGEVAATMGDAPLSANAELSTPSENIMFGDDQQVIDFQGNIQSPIETLSTPAADNMLDESVQTPALQEEAPTRPAPTGRTLLSHLRQSGGISINQRSDIVGESNIANIAGGYGTIFRHNAEYQLQELIQDGMLDEYVPFEARSTATERTQEDIDAAYEYLADRIARGEPVLPYEAELELQMSEQFENLQAVQENNQYFSDDEVNALLQETGYDEIESASDSRIYDARGVAETEGISDSAIENPESENAASGVISGVGAQAGVEATESASATEPEAQVTYNQVDELPTNQVESVPAASTIDAAVVDAEQAEVTQIVEAFTRDKGRITNNTKAKQFNRTYFPAAKQLLEGGDVSPNKFKAAAKAFNEQDYPDFNRAFKRLEAIARYRKDAGKNEVKDVYDSFNTRLESATTPDQLQALSDEVMQSDALSDAQVSRLDEAIADRLDMALEGNLPQPTANTDLLGDDTSTQQAIADAQREADARRNGVNIEGVADVEEFTLTGSGSPADQARAQGAQELTESKPDQETMSPRRRQDIENPSSWVIKNKETGEILFETFDKKKVDALNTAKYEAVPITLHLESLNQPNQSKQDQENDATTSQQDTPDRSAEATRDDGSEENETLDDTPRFSRSDEAIRGLAKAIDNGIEFETGKPVTFNYAHNTESATKLFGKPNKDSAYGRGYEPSGEYVTVIGRIPPKERQLDNLEYGEVTLKNPLVIDNDELNWKQKLSEDFGGKTGKHLSKAVIASGYDGIVTVDNGHASEVVNLQTFDEDIAVYKRTDDDVRELFVQHNISERGLANANKIGGLAAPSLAVAKKDSPLTSFGEITLIANKDLIDRKKRYGAKVFGADIYSPRYPSIEYAFKNSSIDALNESIKASIEATGTSDIYVGDLDRDPEDTLSRSAAMKHDFLLSIGVKPRVVSKKLSPEKRKLINHKALKPYLKEGAKAVERNKYELINDDAFVEAYKEYLHDKFVERDAVAGTSYADMKLDGMNVFNILKNNGIYEIIGALEAKEGGVDVRETDLALTKQVDRHKGKYSQYIRDTLSWLSPKERIFDGYTYSGNRRYKDHTLENVVKMLKKDLRGGENWNYGLGSVRAKLTPEFKSIAEIRKNKDRLVSAEDFERIKKEQDDEMFALAESLRNAHHAGRNNEFRYLETVTSMLADSASMGVNRALDENGFDLDVVSDETKGEVVEFLEKLRSMPTEYFEAKITDEVGIDEFQAAIVPRNISKASLAILEKAGIKHIVKYKDQSDRIAATTKALSTLDRKLKGDILFKRSQSQQNNPEITKAVSEYVSALTEGWKNAPTIKVVADMNDLAVPEVVREQSAEMRGSPKGFYHRGDVFIVAGAHKSAKEVAETVFHEVLGHAGLRGLYGNDLIKILDQVALTKPKELKQKAEKYGYDLNDRSQRLAAAEELLAEMAETKPEVGYVKRTIAAIRKWLREHVPYFKDLELTDQDIIANYLLPARQYVERSVTTHGDYRSAKPAFSLDDLPEIVTVNGQERPTTNSEGNPIHSTLEGVKNFWEWFDGHNVENRAEGTGKAQEGKNKTGVRSNTISSERRPYGLDREGKPRRFYHGTASTFEEFALDHPDKKDVGWLGDGVYLSTDPEFAKQYAYIKKGNAGPNTMPLYAALHNPYYADLELKQKLKNASKDERDRFNQYLDDHNHDGVVLQMDSTTDELMVRNPNQVKSMSGNNGDFSLDDDSILFSRTDPEQTAFQPEWDDLKDETRLTGIVRKLQDKFVDLKEVTESIKATGAEIDDHLNPYLQEELYHGRSAKRVKDFIDLELKPLMEDMKRRGVDMKTFEHYLWAKHAPERNAKMFEINPEQVDENGNPNGSGMTDEAANEFIEGLGASDKLRYEALAKQVYAINKKSAQMLADYGLESQTTVKGWSEDYEFYVPLQREGMDDLAFGSGNGTGQGFNVRGSSVKQAFGSDLEVANILANIAQQRESNVVRGEKNRVAMAVVGMATLHPKKGFWSVDNPETKKVIDPATGLMKRIIDPMYKSKQNVLVARFVNKQGKVVEKAVVFDKFNERAVHLASNLKNLEAPKVEGYMSAVAAVTRWISSVNTQYNPVFGVLNIMRDTQGALLNLSSTKLAGKQAEVSKHILPAIRGIYAEMRSIRSGKGATDNEYAKLFEQFQKGGGQTGYRDMYATKDDRSEAIEDYLTPETWKGTPARKLKDAVGGWLTDYNETLENAVRLATYKAALDNGVSDAQALSIAKNISVNFNRKGTHSVQMGALYAFFNASLQGTARIYETLSGQAGRRILAGAATLGVMQALMLEAADFGDDEPPEFIKDRNIIIPIPFGDKKYVSTPLPLGFNMLVSIPRIMTEMILYRDDIPDRTLHMLEVALDSLNPLGGAGDVRNIIAPSVIDPVVDLSLNRDFSGRSIAIEEYDTRRQSAGHTRAKDSASIFGDYVSYSLNWLTLGTDYTAGYISPTPDQIDYLVGQVTGGVGRESIKAMQTGKSLWTGEDLPLHRIPLVGRFGGNANSQSAVASKYYDNIAKIYKHDTEIKGRLKDRKPVGDYRKEHPEAKLIMYAKGVESSRRNLRKKVREAVKQGKSKDEVKRLNDRLNSIMKRFNERYEAVSS